MSQVLRQSRFAMTNDSLISRFDFNKTYRTHFDRLFVFVDGGHCEIKERPNTENIIIPNMTLAGWWSDDKAFCEFIDFVSIVERPKFIVLAEVESIQKFNEIRVINADRVSLDTLLQDSFLPHFNAVCFDDSELWCAIFDNYKECIFISRLKK